MTEEEGAARLERFARDLQGMLERGLAEALKRARERAIWWSSGPLSESDLRRMGRPYARAERGQARADPGRINIQSRAVVEGWAAAPVERAGGKLRASLYDTAPHARYLYDTSDNPAYADRGTRLALGRPLPERVLADLERGDMALSAIEGALEL
jgi:hypothetical protein